MPRVSVPFRGLLAALVAGVLVPGAVCAAGERPSLAKDLRKLRVPPAWMATTPTSYDTNNPWKDARMEIRRLLGAGKLREAMKLTYIYRQKNDIGNGHEYPMYLFLGGEYAWAEREFQRFIASGHKEPWTLQQLASIYIHYGEHAKALAVLKMALANLPNNAWKINNEAGVNDKMGDVYAAMGKPELAAAHYRKAMSLYPQSKQPYGRQDLPKLAAKSRAKLEMLELHTPTPGILKDGSYTGSTKGYVKDVQTTVTIRGGRIADVKGSHQENIFGDSITEMPKRIIAAGSLKVDCVTGATITSQAILVGAYEALKKAGFQDAPQPPPALEHF